jgi:hypothetical protein
MRLLVVSILSMALLASCYNKKEQQKENKKNEIDNKITSVIYSYITKYDADTTWLSKLDSSGGNRYGMLTIELERALLIDKPIVLVGQIIDISTFDSDNYLFELRTPFKSIFGIFMPDVFFKIIYPKSKTENFLNENMDLLGNDIKKFLDDIIVVAKITAVEKMSVAEDGGYKNIQFCKGEGFEIILIKEN